MTTPRGEKKEVREESNLVYESAYAIATKAGIEDGFITDAHYYLLVFADGTQSLWRVGEEFALAGWDAQRAEDDRLRKRASGGWRGFSQPTE